MMVSNQRMIRPAVSMGMFDMFKGIAIITVVLGHTVSYFLKAYGSFVETFANLVLYGFVIVAGYDMRKKSIVKCIRQLKKAYFVKYIVTACVTLVLFSVVNQSLFHDTNSTFSDTRSIFWSFVLGQYPGRKYFGREVVACGPIWFVVALAGSSLLFNLVLNYTKGKETITAILLCTLIGSTVAGRIAVPYCLMHTFSFIPGLYIGYHAKTYKIFERPINWKIWLAFLASGIVLLIIALYGGYVSFADQHFSLGPISLICGTVFSLLFVYFCTLIGRRYNIIINALEWLGFNSFYILCLHSIEDFAGHWGYFIWKLSPPPVIGFFLLFFFRLAFITVGLIVIRLFQRKQLFNK